ncbi:MAG TPA: hypothetical protein PKD91_13300 [Bacteroidia bacterium]|nr:hypothetical protein [Bacteroidia bacterium]
MKRIVLIFILLISLSGIAFTQPSTFLKMYNKGNSAYAVRELNGNTYVVAGGTDFYYNFHWNLMSPINTTNVHLFKTSSNGTLIWERIFSSLNHRTIATWMEPVDDGGIIVTGHTNSENTWPPDSNDIILIKTDNNGNLSWSKTFDTGKDDLGFCVRQTFDGGFIVSGFHDAVPTSLAGTTYVILIKTDGLGNVIWEKKYQIPVRDLDTAEGLPVVVNQTADSGFVVTGTTAGSHAADVFILRTDPSGDLLWAKSYEHDSGIFRFSLGLDIIESLSGELIVAGTMDKDRVMNLVNYPYILKVNSTGDILNSSTVPDHPFQSGFSSVEQTPDGGYFFTGMGGYSGFGDQAQLLKTDNAFNMQWSRVYTMDGIATMGSRSGRSTTDGSYVFAGKRQFSGTVLMKTNSMGLIPCKNPSDLVEIMPTIFSQNRFPAIISGVNSSNLVLNTQIFLVDTTTVCPVLVSSLPVELIKFNAQVTADNNIQLMWETASEINNNYFKIERSNDGINFTEIGIVKGNGNTTQLHKYSFQDMNTVFDKVVYYRLKEVDFNGESSFSSVIPMQINSPVFTLIHAIFNFQSNEMQVLLSVGNAGTINYFLSDMMGKVIFTGSTNAVKGENLIRIDFDNLPNGIYHLNVIGKDGRVIYKIFH